MANLKDLGLEMIRRSLSNSWHITQAGGEAASYINLDDAIFGHDRTPFTRASQHAWIDELVEGFAQKIKEIAQTSKVSRLAFIDKGGQGPVGALSLASLIIVRTKIEGLLVRPYKRTFRGKIRGRSISDGEEILVISDVATTGRTVLAAAEVVRKYRGQVTNALVAYDQCAGARENLQPKGINLVSLVNKTDVDKSNDEELKQCLAPPALSFVEHGATT